MHHHAQLVFHKLHFEDKITFLVYNYEETHVVLVSSLQSLPVDIIHLVGRFKFLSFLSLFVLRDYVIIIPCSLISYNYAFYSSILI